MYTDKPEFKKLFYGSQYGLIVLKGIQKLNEETGVFGKETTKIIEKGIELLEKGLEGYKEVESKEEAENVLKEFLTPSVDNINAGLKAHLPLDGLVDQSYDPITGVRKVYRWGNYGLSVVNGKRLHSYPFAWEIAVLKFEGENNKEFQLDYSTELTNDVEVFQTNEEASKFILKAQKYFQNYKENKKCLVSPKKGK